jgi:hypothetical protein
MKEWSEFIRSIIRPAIIIWGLVVYGICVIKGIEVPPVLTWLISAVTIAYFGERAVMRLKGK